MGIMKTLYAEIKAHGAIGCTLPTGKSKHPIIEKPYSAKKPKNCPVPVESCLDCPELDCTYEKTY